MRYLLGIYVGGKLQQKIYLDEFPGFFEGVPVTVGRREINSICIPQNTVSRNHAVIKYNRGSVELTDCGSLNKFSVNGKIYDKITLENGMQVVIGSGASDPDSVILLFVDKGASVTDSRSKEEKVRPQKTAPAKYRKRHEKKESGVTLRRLFACMADMVICLFMIVGLCGIIALIFGVRGKIKFFMAFSVVLCFWLYFALAESGANGGTMGKNIFGIAVVDKDGNETGFLRATFRLAVKPFSLFTLFLPVFGGGRCLHDVLAGTYVVRKKSEAEQK